MGTYNKVQGRKSLWEYAINNLFFSEGKWLYTNISHNHMSMYHKKNSFTRISGEEMEEAGKRSLTLQGTMLKNDQTYFKYF